MKARKDKALESEKDIRITSFTILWGNRDDILSVKTRIFGKEVEITFYNGDCNVDNLIGGRIWPMSDQAKQHLFAILEKCVYEWDCDDYTADESDNMHWQVKICTKGKCLRTVCGTMEPPPYGQEIKKILIELVGNENCYFF